MAGGALPNSRQYHPRCVVAIPVPRLRRSGAPDARPAETGAGHGPVPANSLQGYSGRRRRDASVLDADTLQDPIVAAGRMWKLIPLTFKLLVQFWVPDPGGGFPGPDIESPDRRRKVQLRARSLLIPLLWLPPTPSSSPKTRD